MKFYAIGHSEELLESTRRCSVSRYFYPVTKPECHIFPKDGHHLVFSENTLRNCRKIKHRERTNLIRILKTARCERLLDETVNDLRSRIFSSQASWFYEPPDGGLVDEMLLYLWACAPGFVAEFQGRRLEFPEALDSDVVDPLLALNGETFVFDVLGGRRHYAWRIVRSAKVGHVSTPDQFFPNLKKWFEDEDARVVLSLSSGGVRCYGLPPALRILEMIGIRPNIDELWGTSGGAIAAYLYAIGVPPKKLEELSYNIYNERYPDLPIFRSRFRMARSLFRGVQDMRKKATKGLFRFNAPLLAMMKDAERWRNSEARQIPFYAVATDLYRKGPVALTPRKEIPPHLRSILYSCDPMKACMASASVPFIFPPQKIDGEDGTKLLCCDGAISEELPLLMPFLKWYRDQQTYGQKNVKPKLKIFYLDLANHFPESPFDSQHPRKKLTNFSIGRIAARVFDILLCRPKLNFLTLSQDMPDVEVLGVRIDLDKMTLLDGRHIPHIIENSRSSFLQNINDLELQLGSLPTKEARDKAVEELRLVKDPSTPAS